MEIKINTGDRYGSLVIIKEIDEHICPNGDRKRKVLCQCDCGNTTTSMLSHLRGDKATSCGCTRNKHNLSRHPLYRVRQSMIQKCYNPKDRSAKYYSERGIIICDEWINSFMAFYNWSITNGWKRGLTIDRINNDGNYEPSNCRWTTPLVQANNQRSNIKITYKGNTYISLTSLCRSLGIIHKYNTIFSRLTSGKTIDKAVVNLKD